MIEAIVLYGSKARHDQIAGSDTDILGISASGYPSKTFDREGLTFHVYPLTWMVERAQKGSLFISHIVHEGVALYDPNLRLRDLITSFVFKAAYTDEIATSQRMIATIMKLGDAGFSAKLKARYFWALRTMLIARSVEWGAPAYGPDQLQSLFEVPGLSDHIRHRQQACYADCKAISDVILVKTGIQYNVSLNNDENIEALLKLGGIAAATADEILYSS